MASSRGSLQSSTNRNLLTLDKVSFASGERTVLKNVKLTIKSGEIHALTGEHGAGKSSLAWILSGLLKPLSGSLIWQGHLYRFLTPKRAARLGIRIVPQNIFLFDGLPVAYNLLINGDPSSASFVFNRRRTIDKASEIMSKFGFDLDVSQPAQRLHLPDRVLLSIIRQIHNRPKLLVLDEAIEKLRRIDQQKVIDLLQQEKENGLAVLLITHRIDDIYRFADKVTVLREGEVLASDSVSKTEKIDVIKLAYTKSLSEATPGFNNRDFYDLLRFNEEILNKLPFNLIVTDRRLKIKLFNLAAAKYFNISGKSVSNLRMAALFSLQNREIYNNLSGAIQSETFQTFYCLPYTSKLKEIRYLNIVIYPLFDGVIIIGFMVIIQDITEQEELRRQIELSEKLASVGLLAAGVAHEINNPLEIVMSDIDYIRNHFDDHELLDKMNSLEQEIEYISHIVGNLISFSSPNTLKYEVFDINDLLEELIKMFGYNARYKKIGITLAKRVQSIRIKASRIDIRQIVLNLLKNAVEAMPKGGKITIVTAIKNDSGGGYLRLEVRDTGPGVKAGNVDDVFLPFYSTKNNLGGHLGLGLSLTYELVRKYHGLISVKNIKSKGCVFTIRMPVLV